MEDRRVDVASYTHVCTACGARLEVHERYWGRTLRCTSCRSEFIARAPDTDGPSPGKQSESSSEEGLSFITVCGGCGGQLRIRERHLGQRLRCPKCGIEFEASQFEGQAAPSPPPPSPAERSERRSSSTPPDPSPHRRQHPTPGDQAQPPRRPPPDAAPEVRPPSPVSATGETEAIRSYTHSCTACGVQLQVHSRYFGRTLRCTNCGTEFVASPRLDLAPATERVERELPPTPSIPIPPGTRARRRRWIVISVLAALLLGTFLLWLGGDRTRGFASGLFTSDKVRTDLGVLQRDDGGAVIAALDRETVRELISALEAGDQSALAEISSRPQCIEVSTGTRVRVLERRKRAVEARIRVLEGPWASRIVWVPIGWVK